MLQPARSADASPRRAHTAGTRAAPGQQRERERDPRGAGEQPAPGLERDGRRVEARDRVDPAGQQLSGT